MGKLADALAWAARGFRVFPLLPNTKHPAITEYSEQATTDAQRITHWWTEPVNGWELDFNIGCVPHNQIMVDLDQKEGRQGIQRYRDLGCEPSETLVVETTTGGWHAWYAGPPTANSAGRLGIGIDTRGPHGFGVAPGSTIDGRAYRLLVDRPLAPVPALVLERLRAPRDASEDQRPLVEYDLPQSLAFAAEYLDRRPGAVAGEQNNVLFIIAAHLRDLGLSELRARELIAERYLPKCQPPIALENCEAITGNAYLYAQNAPGSKSPSADFIDVVLPHNIPTSAGAPALPAKMPSDNPFMAFGNMRPIEAIPPRPWVLTGLLLRGEVTALLAPGGVGKSQFSLHLAIYLALGVGDVYGFPNKHVGMPQFSMIYDAEDSEDEMSMRLHAACSALGCSWEQVRPYVVLVSGTTLLTDGKPLRMKLMVGGLNPIVDESAKRYLGWLGSAALSHDCAMLAIGPLGKVHEVNENDNNVMSRFMDNLKTLAAGANVAILLGHHTAKQAAASYAGSASASRGAVDIINSARAAFTLSEPTDEDATQYGLDGPERRLFLRLDDAKINRTLSTGQPAWLRKVPVDLANGEQVGAFIPADLRRAAVDMNLQMASALRAEMTARGTSCVTLNEALSMLKHADQVWDMMPVPALKLRIERAFQRPVELGGGARIQLNFDNNKKTIVLD